MKVAFDNFRHSIISTKAHQKTLKDHYLKLNAETVINEIFCKLTVLMNVEDPPSRSERKQKQKRLQCFEAFLQMLTEDKLAQNLFHVAICVSRTELEEAAMEILAPSSPQPSTSGMAEMTKEPPPKGKSVSFRKRSYIIICILISFY